MSCIDRIIELSKEKGFTLSSLCRLINVNRGYFTTAKRTNQVISTERLTAIADVLGTTVEYLRGETDQKEKPTASGELSPKDRKIIELASQLSDQNLDIALKYLEFLANESKNQ